VNAVIKKIGDKEFFVEVSNKIYTKEAILESSYKFTDKYYIHITNSAKFTVRVYFKQKKGDIPLQNIAEEFCNELIDQQLRVDLEKKMEPIRELILKKAFFPFEEKG